MHWDSFRSSSEVHAPLFTCILGDPLFFGAIGLFHYVYLWAEELIQVFRVCEQVFEESLENLFAKLCGDWSLQLYFSVKWNPTPFYVCSSALSFSLSTFINKGG